MKGILRRPSASEHRRTSVPAPARVSALSHRFQSSSWCPKEDAARVPAPTGLFRPVCLSVCLQPVWLANLIACASFRCLKLLYSSICIFWLAPTQPKPLSISFHCLITIEIVSASSSHAPRASQNPALELPRFTHVARKNKATIPIAKASKQELVARLEQYSRRHGDNYPGGPKISQTATTSLPAMSSTSDRAPKHWHTLPIGPPFNSYLA
jgi:hypothetical protein